MKKTFTKIGIILIIVLAVVILSFGHKTNPSDISTPITPTSGYCIYYGDGFNVYKITDGDNVIYVTKYTGYGVATSAIKN